MIFEASSHIKYPYVYSLLVLDSSDLTIIFKNYRM